MKISRGKSFVIAAAVAALGFTAAQGAVGASSERGSSDGSAVPAIASADGTTAPAATGAGTAWHLAKASGGRGQHLSQAKHISLPRTDRLVASPLDRTVYNDFEADEDPPISHVPPRPAKVLNARPPASGGAHANDITIGTSFNGSAYSGWIPPDGGFAVGPHQAIVAVNGAVNVFSKGGAVLSSQTLANFFDGLPDSSSTFDPHVVFDPYSQRFWMVAAASNGTTSSELYVAVSNNSDAMQGWSTWWMPVQANFPHDWCDYPEIGTSSAHYVYFTCNMFSLKDAGGTSNEMIRVMPQSEFTGGGCCSWWEYFNLAGRSIQPTVMRNSGTGNGEFLATSGNGSTSTTLHQYRVTNETACCSSGPTLTEADIAVNTMNAPPCAVQPSSSNQCLEAGNDSRLLGAVWQYPYLYTWTSVSSGGYAKPYLMQINDLNNSVTQAWILNYGNYSTMYPHVGVRPNGDMSMVTDMVSPSGQGNLNPSAWVIGIPNQGVCTVCVDGSAHYVAAGSGGYQRLDKDGRNRWGDYSGAFQDPDGTGIWVMGMYATASNTWNMQVQLTRESGDATPPTSSASVSPAPNANGWNNTNTTVFISAADGGSGVYYQSYFATGAGAFGLQKAGSSVAPTISAEGTTNLYYQATDNWSNSNLYKFVSVRIDKTAPAITVAPKSVFAVGGKLTSSGVPVTTSWAASDSTSGVASYTLQRKVDSGAFANVTLGSPTATSITQTLAPGHSYQYQVRATDKAGNTSAYTAFGVFKLNLVQENAPGVAYSAGWTRQALAGSSGGFVDFSTVNGKTVTFTLKAKEFAWVSTKATNRGIGSVKFDATTPVNVDTKGTTTSAETIVFAQAYVFGTHTFVIKNLGTAGRPRIDLDAFVYMS